MIKRLCSIVLFTAVAVSLLFSSVFAAEGSDCAVVSTTRIDLPDGGYIIEEIISYPTITRAAKTITKGKNSTRYTANHIAVGKVSLVASFTYTGNGAKATSASASAWAIASGATKNSCSASYSGSTAYGFASFSYVGQTYQHTVTLTCDRYGNVS